MDQPPYYLWLITCIITDYLMKELVLLLTIHLFFRCHVVEKSSERKDKHEVIMQRKILLAVETDLVSL